MSLYNPEVGRIVREWGQRYKGLIVDTVELDDRLEIRLYRDNFNRLPDGEQQDIASNMNALLVRISKLGVPVGFRIKDYVPNV